jgi:lantibiotic biosynthesis protein
MAYGEVAERLHDWSAALRARSLISGLTLATYEPQEGRYGYGSAMTAAHAVFAADSAASLAQIRMAAATETAPHALAAASMVDLVTSLFASPDDGLEWFVRDLERDHGRLDRALRDTAFELTAQPSILTARLGGAEVASAWEDRAVALATYRECLAVQRDPSTVVRSPLHLHHVRALGVSPEDERVTNRLARACALRRITFCGDTE